ncbi:hypothetical protein SB773_32980, partial [Bacillus sp. SIMBA_074]|uniref:hypothetical protein n=1 Tax=Bacillus sp. SIMBA_074 TaxID=3085812 RepID=UPI00397DC200
MSRFVGAEPVMLAAGVPVVTVPIVRSVTGPAGPWTIAVPVEVAIGAALVRSVKVVGSLDTEVGTLM